MAEPENIIVPLLREMRAEITDLRQEMNVRFSSVENRLTKIDEAQVSYRQALSGDSLLSQLVTGDFEERIVALEEYKKRDPETIK
jgi:hypothetical protein